MSGGFSARYLYTAVRLRWILEVVCNTNYCTAIVLSGGSARTITISVGCERVVCVFIVDREQLRTLAQVLGYAKRNSLAVSVNQIARVGVVRAKHIDARYWDVKVHRIAFCFAGS